MGTIELDKLLRAQQITPILPINAIVSRGFTTICSVGIALHCKIWYFLLTNPITLSTCIRTLAIFRVSSTSCKNSCNFPLVNSGILRDAAYEQTLSLTLNPRPTCTTSPR